MDADDDNAVVDDITYEGIAALYRQWARNMTGNGGENMVSEYTDIWVGVLSGEIVSRDPRWLYVGTTQTESNGSGWHM